ncbi:MAG: hypothetical protein AB7Q81_01220 [Gammaproteobacteria bacterium]
MLHGVATSSRAVQHPRHRHQPAPVALVAALLACAGCGPSADYLPLDTGHWWYYALESHVLDEPAEARVVMANIGVGELGGQRVHRRRVQATSLDYLAHTDTGVQRIARRDARRTGIVLDDPPLVLVRDLGAWSVPTTLGLVESRTFAPQDRIIPRHIPLDLDKRVAQRDAVTSVPAGQFENCLLVVGAGRVAVRTDRGNASAVVTVTTREWYAPGVGLVRREREEVTDSTFLRSGRQQWLLLEHGD